MKKEKVVAIVLAAGSGKRMGSDVPKQFLMIEDKPILFYSLRTFEDSFVDEIVLVTQEENISYCREEVVLKYGFRKVTSIVSGGKERYHSVYNGLKAISDCSYVMIHDGARPFVDMDTLQRNLSEVSQYGACVTGVPVKDTIKEAAQDGSGFVARTPCRDLLWAVQTPQTFSYDLIFKAYCDLIEEDKNRSVMVTDDAMVAEEYANAKVKLVRGSYANIKITTPEDLIMAKNFITQENR